MATIFTHPVVPLAAVLGIGTDTISRRLLVLACLSSILPDLDVLAFGFEISYTSPYGHRGFTHSVFVAGVVGIGAMFLYRALHSTPLTVLLVISLSTASHGVLDALTDGGMGIAFFWPFSDERYFFPWRPLRVSPIGVTAFLNQYGVTVLKSELLWIWFPGLTLGLAWLMVRRRRTGDSS